MFKIIGCSKCGSFQYVKKDQKSRKCSTCGFQIDCDRSKVFSKANSEPEAQAIIKSLKTPSDVAIKIKQYNEQINSKKTEAGDQHHIFNTMMSNLLEIYPNSMPESEIFTRSKENGLEPEFVQKNLESLKNAGYLLTNSDFHGNIVYKFLNVPFSHGKISISLPKSPKKGK